MKIQKELFGHTPEGIQIELYTLTNTNGLKAKIINYGAILVSLELPDINKQFTDITLGYDSLEEYIKDKAYFGATVGRYCDRITNGKFILNGVEYQLTKNDGEHHLHGGFKGFNKVVWNAQETINSEGVGINLTYLSKDGEEGYPGNLMCTVTYKLTDNNELKINYKAETDRHTIINLTHHSYFNLAGQGTRDILNHELMLNANNYTATDENLIPTGEIKSVKGTPMDFIYPMTIGSRIMQINGGYDHNYIINEGGGKLSIAAKLSEPNSGQVMEVYTTQPGILLYTGNFLDGSIKGKSGKTYNKHFGLCLETQHFPDSPNKPNFPSVILHPGEKYNQITIYKFYTK